MLIVNGVLSIIQSFTLQIESIFSVVSFAENNPINWGKMWVDSILILSNNCRFSVASYVCERNKWLFLLSLSHIQLLVIVQIWTNNIIILGVWLETVLHTLQSSLFGGFKGVKFASSLIFLAQ